MNRDKIKFGLKLLITVSLITILLLKVDWRDSLLTISKISLLYIVLLLLIAFVMITISCIKWQIFLKARNISVSLPRLILLYLIGYFYNNFLPSNVGGDLVRGFVLGKQIRNNLDSFSSVFLERFTGLLGLLILAITAFVFNIRLFQNPAIGVILAFFSIAFFSIILLLFNKHAQRILNKIIEVYPLRLIKNKVIKFLNVIYSIRNKPMVLSKAMAISFFFHIMTIVNTFVVCLAIGTHIPVLDLAVIVPIVLLVSMVPISLNSIGVWEGSFVYFLSLIGINPSVSLSIALVLRAKNLFLALVGGVVFAIWSKLPEERLVCE
ncbi:MAG: YbhN family protein [bacterium]